MLNIAHRGYTHDFPDNTLESIKAAQEFGADGVEFDIQETVDSAFIVHHDDDIDGIPIARLKLEDITRVRLPGNYKIPELMEVLDICSKNMALFIELKQVKSLDKLLQALRDKANTKKIALISFNRNLLEQIGQMAPDIMRGLITVTASGIQEQAMKSSGIKAIGIHYTHLNKGLVDRARLNNMKIYIWGCKDAKSVRQVMQFEIDGIISDCPDIVKKALRSV